MSSIALYRASGLALLLGALLFITGITLAFVFNTDTSLGLSSVVKEHQLFEEPCTAGVWLFSQRGSTLVSAY